MLLCRIEFVFYFGIYYTYVFPDMLFLTICQVTHPSYEYVLQSILNVIGRSHLSDDVSTLRYAIFFQLS